VDPVPVELARRLGADFTIAVNVMSWKARGAEREEPEEEENFGDKVKKAILKLIIGEEKGPPHILSTFLYVVDIMQEEIVRSKLKITSPDMLIHVDTSDFSSNEYYRARQIVERGREVGSKVVDYLRYLIKTFPE